MLRYRVRDFRRAVPHESATALKHDVQDGLPVRLESEGETDEGGAGIRRVGRVQVLHAVEVRGGRVVGGGPDVGGEIHGVSFRHGLAGDRPCQLPQRGSQAAMLPSFLPVLPSNPPA